jgi:hypothetical protein
MRGDTFQTALETLKGRLLFVRAEAPSGMNEVPQLASAMLAIAFAAVMLVAGQMYIEHMAQRPLPLILAALTVSARVAGLPLRPKGQPARTLKNPPA